MCAEYLQLVIMKRDSLELWGQGMVQLPLQTLFGGFGDLDLSPRCMGLRAWLSPLFSLLIASCSYCLSSYLLSSPYDYPPSSSHKQRLSITGLVYLHFSTTPHSNFQSSKISHKPLLPLLLISCCLRWHDFVISQNALMEKGDKVQLLPFWKRIWLIPYR